MKIPLTKPYWGVREEKAALAAVRALSGIGDGRFSRKLVLAISELIGARHVLPTTSCTHGLELAVAAMVESGRAKPGDEVILPSFTMSSTANAVVLAGLKPVFADLEATTCNIDPDDIKRRVTSKTRGLIIVHYAGMPCRMDDIWGICRKNNLFLIEDAAHAIGAFLDNGRSKMEDGGGRWKVENGSPSTSSGKKADISKIALGMLGDIGVYSFHGTKNISCGEGGAVVTNDDELARVMDIYRVNGTNRKLFLEGVVDKYSWVSKGSSYLLSDILCNITLEQIHQIDKINNKRHRIASVYTRELSKYSIVVDLPVVPPGTVPNWHIYALRFRSTESRRFFQQHMRAKGIEVSTHYVPLHSSPMGKRFGDAELPITDHISQTLVRLPIYPGLSNDELAYIIRCAKKALQSLAE